MQTIDTNIGSLFQIVSNYDKLRNEVIRSLGGLSIDSVDMVLPELINLNRAFKRIAYNYLIRKMIFFAKHRTGVGIFLHGKISISEDEFKKDLLNFFKFDDDVAGRLSKILLKLVNETKSNHIKTSRHKKELNEFAYVYDHKCYICGSEVDYLDHTSEKYRTIEHFQPRSLGGNKHVKNLFIACKRCNQAKGDLLSWLETKIWTIHESYINIENGMPEECLENQDSVLLCLDEKFSELICSEIIYIVASIYNYKCAMCSTDNDISDSTYIIEKEPEDSFHVFNLMPVCNLCLRDIDKNLSSQEIYIKRKRISSV